MKIKTSSVSSGFTIIEVLIVVAVMGILLLFAVRFVAGDTTKANFTIAINNLRQQMESLVSETGNGYYPNQNNFKCVGDTSGATPPNIQSIGSNAGVGEGQNFGCIFLGKLLQFRPGGNPNPQSGSQFSVYPIVGNQFVGQQSPTTVAMSSPVLGFQSGLTQYLQYGLTTYSVDEYDSDNTHHNTTAVAFLAGDANGKIAGYSSSSSSSSSGGPTLNNGAEPLSLYYDGSVTAGSIANNAGGIQTSTLESNITPSSPPQSTGLKPAFKVTVCVTDGSKSGLLQFGGTGSLTVSLTILNDGTCL